MKKSIIRLSVLALVSIVLVLLTLPVKGWTLATSPGLTAWASGTWDKPSITVNYYGKPSSGYYVLQKYSTTAGGFVNISTVKIVGNYQFKDYNVAAGTLNRYRLKHNTSSTLNLIRDFVWRKITSIGFTSNSTVFYLPLGTTSRYSVTISPIDAADKRLVWSSSNASIFTVTSSGLVTGVSNGTAILSVRTLDGGFSDSVSIKVGQYEKAHFPMNDMAISQQMGGLTSHVGYNAIDLRSQKTDNVFAPFKGRIVIPLLSNGSYYPSNMVFLQSVNPVRYADGTVDYMTCVFAHDSDISNLKTGMIIEKNTVFYQQGNAPTPMPWHLHFECGRGTLSRTSMTTFQQSSAQYSGPALGFRVQYQLLIYKALYVKTTTTLSSTRSYPWVISN